MTQGWWRFRDHDLRPSYPLLSHRQWRGLLEAQGSSKLDMPAGLDIPGSTSTILAARRPLEDAKASGSWLILADAGGVGPALAELLEEHGKSCVMASSLDQLQGPPSRFT